MLNSISYILSRYTVFTFKQIEIKPMNDSKNLFTTHRLLVLFFPKEKFLFIDIVIKDHEQNACTELVLFQ